MENLVNGSKEIRENMEMMEPRVTLERPETMVKMELTAPRAPKVNQVKTVLKETLDRTGQPENRETKVRPVRRDLKVQLVNLVTTEMLGLKEIRDHKEKKVHKETQERREKREIQEARVLRVNLENQETLALPDLMVSRDNLVWTPLKRPAQEIRVSLENLERQEMTDHRAKKEFLTQMKKRETRDQ